MFKVENTNKYEQDFAFYTLVTCFDEYKEMVDSAKRAGFDREKINFFYFDNTFENSYDGYKAINLAIKNSDALYIIVCHQDILFKFDDCDYLIEKIEEVNKLDPNWAVLGNAGRNNKGEYFINITDPNGRQKIGKFPNEVMSLDENFLVINARASIGCSNNLNGFHLYGTDLCQNANYLGYSCYVIDFHLYHKSAGKLNEDFFKCRKDYTSLQKYRKKSEIIYTACTKFYCSNNSFLNYFFNFKLMNKIYRIVKGIN